MSVFIINVEDATVKVFATKRKASAQGNAHPIFDSVESLIEHSSIPTGAMLKLYNNLTNENVARFSDRESGARRLFKVLQALAPVAEEVVDSQVEVAQEEKAAAKEARKAAKQAKDEARARGELKPGRKAGTGVFVGKKIIPLKQVNPRRAGTFGFKSYEIIREHRDGVPFEEYIAAGGRPQDLRWDLEHKWVELK